MGGPSRRRVVSLGLAGGGQVAESRMWLREGLGEPSRLRHKRVGGTRQPAHRRVGRPRPSEEGTTVLLVVGLVLFLLWVEALLSAT